MNRSRALTAIATAALSASLLAGCGGSDEEEIRIAEPVLDFPQTSVTLTPTPTTTTTEPDDEEDDEDEDETTSSTTSSSTSSSSTTRSSTSRTSTRSNGGSRPGTTTYRPAPAPAQNPQNNAQPAQPGAACPWPTQSNHGAGEEYSTFCDREWARTVTPGDNQEFFWVADGGSWVTVDPAGYPDGPCWHRDDFHDAPEAIRNAVTYCP